MRVLFNIAANSIKRQNLSLMVEKVLRRVSERRRNSRAEDVLAWCKARAESWPEFATKLNPTLWEETQAICPRFAAEAQTKLDQLGQSLGGSGHYPLLYFLTRHIVPQTAVETGVAAGWSSLAVLLAMRKNDSGRLYSSDFPYFRLENPERYIGYVVDESLKDRWVLLIDGDRNNLPVIAGQVESIHLFHYDSDKSYDGREFAWNCIEGKLAPRATVIFDDIQDNFHFRDLVAVSSRAFRVFAFGGKYVGLMTIE